jgi:hypothetical protein
MIAMVKQKGDLGNIHRLAPKIIDRLREHLNESLIIREIGEGAMGEKRKAQRVNCEVSLNPIGAFVATEAVRFTLGGITSILDDLRINDQKCCPLPFFWAC